MLKFLDDGKLSVFVPFVLEYLLDGDELASLSNSRLKNDSERAISDNLLDVVG